MHSLVSKTGAAASSRSEEILRQTMANAPVGMCLVAPDGSFLTVNKALCELLDRPEPQLLRTTWQELTHPDDLDIDLAHVQDLLDGRRDTYRLTKRYLRPDGSTVWGDLSVSCVRDSEGKVEFFISQILDISDRVRKASQLARSEEVMRKTMANAPVGMCLVAPDGSFLTVNKALCELLDRPEPQLLRTTWQELTHPDDLDIDLAHVQDLLDGRRDTYRLTKRFLRPGGSTVWGDLSVSCVRDSEGKVEFFISQIADVTAAKAQESAAQRALQHYRALAENSSDVVLQVDPGSTILWISPNCADLFGRDQRDLVGTSILELVVPEHRERVANALADLHRSRLTGRFEVPVIGKEGATWVDVAGTPMQDPDGRYLGRIARMRDVSKQVEHRRKLEHLAAHDQLTGVHSREEGLRRLALAAETEHPPLLAFIDVDDLKEVNDRLGHEAGDILLNTVGRRITQWLRADDIVARIGGDEFIALITATAAAAEAHMHDLVRHVHQPLDVRGVEIRPRLSIGLTRIRTGEQPADAIARSDRAMYEAKDAGGNTVRVA